ncbi:hypothetical protein [Qipengyuania profunda]|jgi:hypothetical protein|uniref:hypothetical protein n=1 Tax=Qipengyuania profunda TaxID=3113984 RepID=UPI002A18C72B|nr:hypothetical protein [Qipengyuania sp. HL-TH1]WPL57912.1 hypothetical protein SD421_05625 [Qipengyuania sp. HL-TH5]
MAEVNQSEKQLTVKSNLRGSVQNVVVRSLTSDKNLATLLQKEHRQAMVILTNNFQDIPKSGEGLDLNVIEVD